MRSLSIVMTYYNRPQQLDITLRSIQLQLSESVPHPEIIIVDDASDPAQSARQVIEKYLPILNIRLIEIRKEQKWWMNPCVPFNMGFSVVTGDVTIIQNPECVHLGDILDYVTRNVTDKNYLVSSCFTTTRSEHDKFGRLRQCKDEAFWPGVVETVQPVQGREWYTHPTLNPTNLHFCTALTTANLRSIGGFDERFAEGYCWDDNSFLYRIQKHGLSVDALPISAGLVVHQWHEKDRCGPCPEWYKNQKLYQDILAGKQPV